jgi:hypothetical protein
LQLLEVVPSAPSPMLYVDHVIGTGVDLLDAMPTVSTLPEGGQPEHRAISLPPLTHLRYCMKSVALDFVPQPAK